MISHKKTKLLIKALWIGAVLFLLSSSILKVLTLDIRSGEQWQKYYTLITSDAESLESLLTASEISFLSYNQSTIVFNDISGMNQIPLADVQNRFNAVDPRIDPYMKKLPLLFHEGSNDDNLRDIIYVEKQSISLLRLYMLLYRNISDDTSFWTISGYNPFKIFIPLSVYFVYFLLFTALCKRNRLTNALALLGFFPFIYIFGSAALITGIILSYLFFKKSNPFYILITLLLTSLFVRYSQILSVDYVLLSLSSIFCLSLFYLHGINKAKRKTILVKTILNKPTSSRQWNKKRFRFRKPEHELFSPVQIMTATKKKARVIKEVKAQPRGRNFIKPLAASFIVISSLSLLFQSNPDQYSLPLPESNGIGDWTLENTSRLTVKDQNRMDTLISPADYITHLAYQEGFLYGSKWVFPKNEKPLLYPIYNSDQNVFSKSYEIKAEYSEKWFNDKISVLKNDNPAKLLFSTQYPSFVIKKPNHGNYQSFMLLKFSFSMLVLLLLFFSDEKVFNKRSINIKKKLLRRNEQVA